jgi:single-stranded DNA-binding protein
MNRHIVTGFVGRHISIIDIKKRGKIKANTIAKFQIATTDGRSKATEWVEIAVWGSRAKNLIEKYITPGTHLLIEGAVKRRYFIKKDGSKTWFVATHVESWHRVEILEGRKVRVMSEEDEDEIRDQSMSEITEENDSENDLPL